MVAAEQDKRNEVLFPFMTNGFSVVFLYKDLFSKTKNS